MAVELYFIKSRQKAIKLKRLRMFKTESSFQFILLRDSYFEAWHSLSFQNSRKSTSELTLDPLNHICKMNVHKIADITTLYKFLKPTSREFYEALFFDPSISTTCDNVKEQNNSSNEE